MLKGVFLLLLMLLIAGTEWKLGLVLNRDNNKSDQSHNKPDDFHFLEFPFDMEEGESISQNDLILISNEEVLRVLDCVFLDFADPDTM